MSLVTTSAPSAEEAAMQLRHAASAEKCWSCGCLHSTLKAVDDAFHTAGRTDELTEAMTAAASRLQPVRYDCLGCQVCYPALAMNELGTEADTCPTDEVERREGWPPLPGSYQVLRYRAPVAVCTLTDDELGGRIAAEAGPDIAIVGALQTENLGIERLIQNTLGNPHVRFLVLCGADSQQTVGHLPGQSLVALAENGLDERNRIIGARGKRPVMRNVSRDAVEHFRQTVEVIDLVGESQAAEVLDAVRAGAAEEKGPAAPFAPDQVLAPTPGYVPAHMVSDPVGYFVVHVEHRRRLLSLEHYQNNGVLDAVIEGLTPAELYTPALERGMVSRPDHAAYLGQELARAERALLADEPYVQDAAAETDARPPVSHCGCNSQCGG